MIYKQGAIVEPYTRPASAVVATQPIIEKKNLSPHNISSISPRKQGIAAITEKTSSAQLWQL